MDSRQHILTKVPVARILIPFIAGILLLELTQSIWILVAIVATAVAVYVAIKAMLHASPSPTTAYRLRRGHIMYIALLACSLGWTTAWLHEPTHIDTARLNGHVVVGRIDQLEFTDFSTSMRLALQCGYHGNGQASEIDSHPTINLSVKGCNYMLRLGDLIAFRCNLDSVRNMGNPDEMDYAGYMRRQGIAYGQHVTSTDSAIVVGHMPTLMNRLGNSRLHLQRKIIASSLPEPVQNFVIALVLGESHFIDQDTRHEFSNAGVAHILALSGLHVGIEAMILWWLLLPLDYLRLKNVRLVITLIALTAADAFTGMPSSVVRATIMTAFVSIAMIMHRKSSAINALASAALFILAFSPSDIYDVGFQLSFVTVGAILFFCKRTEFISRRRKVAYFLYSTAIVSAIASASTLTLSAHYFHNISLVSIVANMVIIPTFPFFMTLCVLLAALCAMGGECEMLNSLLTAYYRFMERFINGLNALPMSHIDNVWVTDTAVWASFGIMLCLAAWMSYGNRQWLLGATSILALALMHSAYVDYRTPDNGLVVFNSFDSTPIVCFNDGNAVAWIPDNEAFDINRFVRSNAGFMAHYHIRSFKVVKSSCSNGRIFIKPPFAYMGHTRIMAIGHGKWRHMTKNGNPSVDLGIITKQFHSNIAIADTLYQIRKYVLSGDIYGTGSDSIENKLRQLHRPWHNVKSDGALMILGDR